jgi:ATP-dependent RNA helicase SUPV3L1/SUV3
VRFGAFHIFTPALLKPAATELRLLLWALQLKKAGTLDLATLPSPPGQGLTSAVFDTTTPAGFYSVCGYRICGSRVVRIDMLERLADLVRDRVFWKARFPDEVRPAGSVEGGGFTVVADMMSLVGCSGEVFEGILKSLGFRNQKKKIKRPVVAVPAPVEATPVADVVTEAVATTEPVEAAPAIATEPLTEDIEIDVWWPKDTGPFRHKPEAKKPEAQRPKRPERKPREAERKPRNVEPPRKPEKPMDPNSPFAALLALKAKMTGN